jgi:hypothetical protein
MNKLKPDKRRINHKIINDIECKYCIDCNNWFALDQFYFNNKAFDKLSGRCAKCSNEKTTSWRKMNRHKIKKYPNNQKRYRNKHQEKVTNSALRCKYGITLIEYNQMAINQNNRCDICKNFETRVDPRSKKLIRLAVDHDHKTGKIRGLLCAKHNRMIGLASENLEILQNAINYLKKYE